MHVDLGGREANTRCVVHRFEHVIDQLAEGVVDSLDRFGLDSKARIWKFKNRQFSHNCSSQN